LSKTHAKVRNAHCRPAFSGIWRELDVQTIIGWEIDLLCGTIAYVSSASITAALRAMFAG